MFYSRLFAINRIYWVSAIYLLIVTCYSCQPEKPDGNVTEKKIDTLKKKTEIPLFNEDSAYQYIVKQVAFGPRVPNTDAHRNCGEYLTLKLAEFADTVIVQKMKVRAYDGTLLDAKNIIASFSPEKQARVLLCAHWDSRPYADHDPDKNNHKKPIDGANDGASGVGVLIELARLFKIQKPNVGIDIILFDAEDYGQPEFSKLPQIEDSWCLGSQHWAKNPHKSNYRAKYGILLDMVGAADAKFTFESVSMYFAPDIMNKVWNTAHRLGYDDYFIKERTPEITDDHLYINQIIKIPTIDIVHYDASTPSRFYKYWHTLNDNLSNIDKQTLKAVGHTVSVVVYEEY